MGITIKSIKELVNYSIKLEKLQIELNNKHSLYFENDERAKKQNEKYCYIVVKLPFSDKDFYYISNYFKIKKGNKVLVYTGNGTDRYITEVEEVYFYNFNEVPFPIEKTKLVKQVFDSESNIEEINELRNEVNKYPPIKNLKILDWF